MKSKMKRFFRNIHLYLSLVAGLIIMITCFTGAVLVFEDELEMWTNPSQYWVENQGQPLPIDTLVSSLQSEYPKASITSLKVYSDPERSVELSGKGLPGKAYINPYTGKILNFYNYRDTIFYTNFALHRWMLSGDFGKLIVGIATVIFLFILITGIVLWWPRNKQILKNRLKIKTDGNWKRLNHDLHIVVGFYTAILLFIFAFTGLAWSFTWVNDGIYWVTNSSKERTKAPESNYYELAEPIGFDTALRSAKHELKDITYPFLSISMPTDSVGAIRAQYLPDDATHVRDYGYIYLDQYTAEPVGKTSFSDYNLGRKVRTLFYPVHVGSILGLPGRVIAFIVCLLGTTFPITGFIMWINRLRKKKKSKLV